MTFRKFDAGKGLRPTSAPKGDCQVRALTTASGMSYGNAYSLLYAIQAEMHACHFTLVEALRANDPRLKVKRSIPCAAVKGQPRMTGAEFCRKYPKGSFILQVAKHVVAVEDGVLIDSWDSSRKCVYGAWEIAT